MLQIWCMPAKGRGRFFSTDEAGLAAAVDWVVHSQEISGQQSVYARMTTLARKPETAKGSRGGAEISSHFIGFWTDLDFGTIGHKPGTKKQAHPLPPDAGEAQRVYAASGLPDPSILVNSGGGLYHLVLLDQPLDITDPVIRGRVADMSRRWQRKVGATAKRLAYHYGEGVFDLARVLRVPGTVNAKEWDNQRATHAMHTGARYTFEELEALVPEPPAPVRNTSGQLVDPSTGEILHEMRISGRPTDGSLRPGDDFNERADWKRDVLIPSGWQYSSTVGSAEYWTRPGKDVRDGHSASLGWVPDRLWAWSAGDSGLEEQRAYDKFSAYTAMIHGGDYSAAARDLAARGYGTQTLTPVPAPRVGDSEDMWGGQVTSDGHVITAEVVAEVTAPSADWTGLLIPVEADESAPPLLDGSGGDDGGSGDDTGGAEGDGDAYALPMVDITNERDALHNLVKEIADGALPETYIRDGKLVHVGVVSGARNGRRKKEGAAAERQAPDMNASQLRALIAQHMVTLSFGAKGPVPKLPTEALCKSILARTEWPTMPDLVEITRMPFVRPDGTVCQTQGYDSDTGTWLNVDDGFPAVPETPSADEIAEAKDLLLSKVLGDFPFVSPGDRANYLGLLLAPALKQVIGGLYPFGVITAAAPGSGKSLLTEIISRTYGGNGETNTLSRQDEEVRKVITSKLMTDPHAVVTFDNIGKTHAVDSPVLAQLMTSSVWSDRALGSNDTVSRVNDKLWLGTGNNVRLGGDMASRSVFVRIDPKMEKPDKRDTSLFAVGDLKTWLATPENQVKIIHALLVLVRSWASAGMPRVKIEMRTFTPWAQTVGGLLNFHGIEGFLSSTEDVDDADDEAYEWAQFLSAWQARHGDDWMTTAQLLASHKSTQFEVMSGQIDPWNGSFPVRENGQAYTTHALGAKLKHVLDRPFQGWVLRRMVHKTTNQRLWRAERMPDPNAKPTPVHEQMTVGTEDV